MNKNALLKKLDNVLIYLEKQNQPPSKTIEEISKGLKEQENESELLLILNKLIVDEYVQFEDRDVLYEDEEGEYSIKNRYYIITFDGRFFILTSGYVKQNKLMLQSSLKLDELENDKKKRDETNKKLTVWIAIATCIAGAYYIIEIYKELHLFCHHHKMYWIWEAIPSKKVN